MIKERTGAKIAIGEHVREVKTIVGRFSAGRCKAEGGTSTACVGRRADRGGRAGPSTCVHPGNAADAATDGDAVFVGDPFP